MPNNCEHKLTVASRCSACGSYVAYVDGRKTTIPSPYERGYLQGFSHIYNQFSVQSEIQRNEFRMGYDDGRGDKRMSGWQDFLYENGYISKSDWEEVIDLYERDIQSYDYLLGYYEFEKGTDATTYQANPNESRA